MISRDIHGLVHCFSLHNHYRGYVLSFLCCIWGCCVYAQQPHVISGRTQGTTYLIKYYADVIVLKNEVDSVLKVIDNSMSLYQPNTLIVKFNDPKEKSITMDAHMKKVVKKSFETYKITKGFFDITVYPLLKLWGFGADGAQANPNPSAIDSVRQLIGMRKLRVKGNRLIKLQPNISIDLNGIAQGYTVDVLAAHLKKRGITDFLVEIGGEIRAEGNKPTGPFAIELYRPENIAKGEILKIRLNNNAVTSSGTYERQRNVQGKLISHHMNPLTGKPLESSIVSATVIAKTAMQADALDNYFMSLAPEEAIKFANSRKDIEVYIVYFEDNTFKELQSSGFNTYIY